MSSEISDQPISSLMYKGATTTIVATYQPWFNPATNKHHESTKVEIPYSTKDPVWVNGILDKWQKMGIGAFTANWYGDYQTWVDDSTHLMFQEAAKRGIMGSLQFDKGVFTYKRHTTYSNLQEMKYQLDYIKGKYLSLPNYHKYKDGRFLMLEFCGSDLDGHWAEVAAYNKTIAWLGENVTKEKVTAGAGVFSWPPTQDPASAETWFYAQQKNYPGKIWMGSIWKGFNDYDPKDPTKSVWGGPVRINPENNGAIWLSGFDIIDKTFSSSNQLEFLLIVTWNDHEEGTGIEFGIAHDSAITITLMSGQASLHLSSSNYKTIQRVDALITLPNGNVITQNGVNISNPIDLTQYTDAGDYKLVAKIVGRAGFKNIYSAPATATLKVETTTKNTWLP